MGERSFGETWRKLEADVSAFIFLYTTFPDEAAAARVARELVEARLAACANIIPGMRSIYRYGAAVDESQEVVAIFKLPEELGEQAAARLRERHPYETPVVATFAVAPDAATAAWLREVTG